jgi:hypothetical protein
MQQQHLMLVVEHERLQLPHDQQMVRRRLKLLAHNLRL